MLKLNNVTISYKDVPTVQNFNLDMKEGQVISLVGESGSGKTTVIRAILGTSLQVVVKLFYRKEVSYLREKTFYLTHRSNGESLEVPIFP